MSHANRERESPARNESMSKALPLVGLGCLTVLGAILLYWSGKLSLRYNAWTTSFRQRHPDINPQPTRQMREFNTKIMMWIFRIVGAFLILFSILALIA
jgi:uncharacterized membrane protein YjgN (DUF898 family)